MPRLHSRRGRDERRDRAIERGYMVYKNGDTKYGQVQAGNQIHIKIMNQSIKLHQEHQRIAGSPSHFARSATLAAKPFIGREATNRALRLHSLAGKAKHSLLLQEQDQDKDQNDQQQEQKEEQDQDQKEQNSENPEEKDSQQNNKQSQFDSTRLEKQGLDSIAAAKLLEIIQNEEQKVQEKLRKYNSTRKRPEKDW